MNPFFTYLIKSSISLVVLYCLFRFVMRNDRNHALNRFILLGILFVSAIVPFLNIQFFYEEASIKQVEVFREFVSAPVFSEALPTETIEPVIQSSGFSINPWLAIYMAVIVVLLSRIVFGVIRVTQIIKKAEKQRFQKIVLAVVKEMIQPFSFFNKVVLSEKDFTENKDIIVAHEHSHIKQLHAIDLMVCELFTMLHFFNPFMWLLRRDLKLIHEFQADEAVLNKGIDAKKYQLLVLEKSVGERRFAMANHFTQKPILKRLKMMQSINRKQWAWAKTILFVPLLVLLLQAFARPELITSPEELIPVINQVDQTEKWLEQWTIENIGKGFVQPGMKSSDTDLQKDNNILVILLNRRDQLLVENEYAQKEQIKQIVKEFLGGKDRKGKPVVDYIEKDIPFIGKMKVSKGFITFQHDLDSSDEAINFILRSVGEACLEARQEKSQILFQRDYFDLDEEKQEAVDEVVPIWFWKINPKINKNLSASPIHIKIMEGGKLYWGSAYTAVNGENKYFKWTEEITYSQMEKRIHEITKAFAKVRSYSNLDAYILIDENVSRQDFAQVRSLLQKEQILDINVSGMDNIVPLVMVHKNWVSFDWKTCRLEDLYSKVLNRVENKAEKTIEIQVYDGTPVQKVEQVYAEMNKIQNLKIIRNKVLPPPPPPPNVIEVSKIK